MKNVLIIGFGNQGKKRFKIIKKLNYNLLVYDPKIKKYSNKNEDLGNIGSYNEFVERLCEIYIKMYSILKDGAYVVIILKNVKKEGKLYPLAWDVALKLSETYELKDEKIWIQDKIGLAPYGYPYSWVSNILHHYCLILQKKPNKKNV